MPMVYDQQGFYDDLVEHGFIIPTSIQGGYGRGAAFEKVLAGFDALVLRQARDDDFETVMFPPIVARSLIESVGYMDNFPQLCGSISSFFGNERDAKDLSAKIASGESWDGLLAPTESML